MKIPLALTLTLLGCGGGAGSSNDAATQADATEDKAASCAATFGTAIQPGFGRLDGTVRAFVPPGHPTCAMPNGDHAVVQVDANGATYRMVLNVQSDAVLPDRNVRLASVAAPLPGPPFKEGWTPTPLDYALTLDQHSPSFVPHAQDELVALVAAQLQIGAKVSVYGSSSGGASAHDLHRHLMNQDGAIVLDPTGTPKVLLFAFSDQTF